MKKLLDEMIERHLASGEFVGANAAVYRDGRCLYSGSFGYADREAQRPMTQDTIFRIYSMTKPVTAVAAMQLTERGLLHPDQPVSRYIPAFSAPQVYEPDGSTRPAQREILVQDLFNMRSGLPYPNEETPSQRHVARIFGDMVCARDAGKPFSTMALCEALAEVPLAFDPGTHWEYGTSADVLGGVIEAASGMELRSYLQANIFGPLGMADTDFYVPPEKLGRFAAAYQWSEKGLIRDEGCYLGLNNYRSLPAFISGGAGLTSTVPDYAKFACALANGGTSPDGVRLLSSRSVDYIRTPQVFGEAFRRDQQWDSLRGYDYGSLVRVLTDRAAAGTIASLGEFGWDGWTGTYFCADPAENLVILFWIQVANAGTTLPARLMRNIVYGSL